MVPVKEFSAIQLSQMKLDRNGWLAGWGLIKGFSLSVYSQITEMIEEADRDGSGSIEFSEFLSNFIT